MFLCINIRSSKNIFFTKKKSWRALLRFKLRFATFACFCVLCWSLFFTFLIGFLFWWIRLLRRLILLVATGRWIAEIWPEKTKDIIKLPSTWMVKKRSDAKWSGFRMPFEYQTAWPFENRTIGHHLVFLCTGLVFKWSV